ncbi:MAG TPA: UDP-3-O-(3-hydroxymyristoyl)glucosamine N-acyltransferase [Planctomycetota bacterium]|nr:UDP-3-O-(3-hydroxymyristoyl)glucosamine N-acyltransferase [Planctomycetota bacterium]
MTRKTLGELAELVQGALEGDPDTVITAVAGVREARPGQITFAANLRYEEWLRNSRASAALVKAGMSGRDGMPVIVVDDPERAFATIVGCFAPGPVRFDRGIHPSAIIAPDAKLGRDVSVGACSVVEAGAVIGDRTVLRPLVYVGPDVEIGSDCLLHPHVALRERVHVGNRCILHAGVVIGTEGFGYERAADGSHHMVPQTGTVVIEDDVEIGACSCVDRARFGETIVGKGTKIDNLVQVGHNCVIGANAILVAQVGLCGSAHVGSGSVLAGKAAINGHVTVGNHVLVGGKAGVTHDVPDGMRISGFPAQDHAKELRLMAQIRRLPELAERVRELERKLRELGHATNDDRPTR